MKQYLLEIQKGYATIINNIRKITNKMRKSAKRWYYFNVYSPIGEDYMKKYHNETLMAKKLWHQSNSSIVLYYLEDKRIEFVASRGFSAGQKEALQKYIEYLKLNINDLDSPRYSKYALKKNTK